MIWLVVLFAALAIAAGAMAYRYFAQVQPLTQRNAQLERKIVRLEGELAQSQAQAEQAQSAAEQAQSTIEALVKAGETMDVETFGRKALQLSLREAKGTLSVMEKMTKRMAGNQ